MLGRRVGVDDQPDVVDVGDLEVTENDDAILFGAEINAESEQQTVKDSTKGPEQPIGERDAVKADSVPAGEPEKKGSPA